MGHYDEHYEKQDRAYKNLEIEEEASKIRNDFLDSIPNDIYSKGWQSDLVEKLAACRVHCFREKELNDLLTQIVKNLHRL